MSTPDAIRSSTLVSTPFILNTFGLRVVAICSGVDVDAGVVYVVGALEVVVLLVVVFCS